jgi:membrane protease YdiL (CAAX protease family)
MIGPRYATAPRSQSATEPAEIHPCITGVVQNCMVMPNPRPVTTRTVIGTGVLAFLLTLVVGGIWSGLVVANLATTSAVPWAVLAMAGVLWVTWQYLRGAWAPASTSQARRRLLRANPVRGNVFGWAIAAGLLSVVALVGSWIVLVQLARPPTHSLPDYSAYPALTVASVILMASVVGAVVEEAGFRGYFQGTLERVVPAPAAIAIVCLVMAPEHALTQGFVWTTVLFYVAVDAIFGITAYLTGSIVPGIVVHAIGLAVFFALVWPADSTRQPVAAGGADLTFWLHAIQTIVFGFLALLAFRHLATLTVERRGAAGFND